MTPKHHLISGRQCSPDHPAPCRCHRYAALCIEKCQTPRRANLAWQISLQGAQGNIFATSNVSSRPCIFALPHFSPNGSEVWSSFCGANGQAVNSPSTNLSLLLGYSSSQAEHIWRNGPERRIEDARKVPGSKAGKLKVSKHCVALWCSAKRV